MSFNLDTFIKIAQSTTKSWVFKCWFNKIKLNIDTFIIIAYSTIKYIIIFHMKTTVCNELG